MEQVAVWYQGWGDRWQLATVAQAVHQVLFECTPEALRQQLQLSPIVLPPGP
jgi:serine/threonine-protein kinase HipA